MEQKTIFDISDLNNGIKIKKGDVHSFYTHTHLYNEMIIYEPFDGFIMINNEKNIIDSPTVALVTTSSFHSTHKYGENDAECIKISFTNDMVSPYFHQKLNHSIILNSFSDHPILNELISRLPCRDGETEYKKIILESILLVLCESGRQIRSVESMNVNALVTDTLNIINRRFTENITLDLVAQDLNVTPQYLSCVFSKNMKISFSHYLSNMRLRYAAGLLSDNTMNITEICYSCGYRNLSHFIRSFKKKYGVSPNKYKN